MRGLSRTSVDATTATPVDASAMQGRPGVSEVVVVGDRVTCAVETTQLGGLLEWLGTHGIRTLASAPPTLEDLFLEQYRTPTTGGSTPSVDPGMPAPTTGSDAPDGPDRSDRAGKRAKTR